MSQAQAQTQTLQPQAVTPVVKEHSFAMFTFLVVAAIALIVFLYGYLAVRRRKTTPRHTDQKAGDEGED